MGRQQKIAYIHCGAGVSSGQLLAAMLDAGLAMERVQEYLLDVPVFAPYRLQYEVVRASKSDNGSSGAVARLVLGPGIPEPDVILFEIWQAMFDSSYSLPLPPPVQSALLDVLRLLAESQVVVRGLPRSLVAFPIVEVAEICVVIWGLRELGVQRVYATPLPLAAEPPDQLTLELARRAGLPWQPAATDTHIHVTAPGVALLATLAEWSTPALVMEQIGYGFAPDFPLSTGNAMHLYLGHDNGSSSDGEMESDWVAVIESHIDNMSGELLGGLMERLFAAGALDVTFSPLQMKKNRPASLITVIAPLALGEALSLIILRETSTLGVRIQHVRRLKAQREQQRIETALGSALVKVKRLGSRIVNATPEYDECQRLAHEHNLPLMEVYEIVRDAIRRTIVIQ